MQKSRSYGWKKPNGSLFKKPSQTFCKTLKAKGGQSSVEFLALCAAFLAMVLALGTLWHAAQGGIFQQLDLEAASHTFSQAGLGAWQDILAY